MKPRKKAPSATNKYYIHSSKGGYNKCILIKGNSVLPNCVGYCYGRWLEISGKKTCKLPMCNAEDWYNHKDGYKRGQTPRLGAVMCFRKGKTGTSADGAGHVLIVEEIYSDGSVLCSQSGYGCQRFWTSKIKKPYSLAGYDFQGFIYNPDVKEKSNYEVIEDALAFAKKIANDDKFHYVAYDSNDEKTKQCPICHPALKKIKKYCGYNCIGYVSACFHHAGVKTVKCTASGLLNNDFAHLDNITEKKWRKRNGAAWDLVKKNKKLPIAKKHLRKGDVILCYSGKKYKHTVLYAGDGYVYEACHKGIRKRKYSTLKNVPKVAFRFTGGGKW